MTVIDKFQRPVLSLRISITNRCNADCFYCHHDGIIPQEYEMTSDEIYRISKVAKEIGIQVVEIENISESIDGIHAPRGDLLVKNGENAVLNVINLINNFDKLKSKPSGVASFKKIWSARSEFR